MKPVIRSVVVLASSPGAPCLPPVAESSPVVIEPTSSHAGLREQYCQKSFTLLARDGASPTQSRMRWTSTSAVAVDPPRLLHGESTCVRLQSIDGKPFRSVSVYPESGFWGDGGEAAAEHDFRAMTIGRCRNLLLRLDHPDCKKVLLSRRGGPAPISWVRPFDQVTVIPPVAEAGFLLIGEELTVHVGRFNGYTHRVHLDALPELGIEKPIDIEPGDRLPVSITVSRDEPGEIDVVRAVGVDGREMEPRVHGTVVGLLPEDRRVTPEASSP